MTAQEQIEQAANEYAKWYKEPETDIARNGFLWGGLKGMEIQKEIDRQEIERLKEALDSIRLTAGDYSPELPWGHLSGLLDKIESDATDALKS